MKRELIGHVCVDSGQILIIDPCYIDNHWIKHDPDEVADYVPKVKDQIDVDDLDLTTSEGRRYRNARIEATAFMALAKDHAGEMSYLGASGVKQGELQVGKLATAVISCTYIGDGSYPVYALLDDDDFPVKLEIDFLDTGWEVEA